jgi:hypothetical protein
MERIKQWQGCSLLDFFDMPAPAGPVGRSLWYAIREGGWRRLAAEFHPPCVRGAQRFFFDRFGVNPFPVIELDSETRRKLEGLGYLQ